MWNNNSGNTWLTTRVLLRVFACGYVAYLGYKILKTIGTEEAGMPPWLAYTAGIVFIVFGVGFAVYSLITARKRAAEAEREQDAPQEIDEETPPEQLPEQSEETEE